MKKSIYFCLLFVLFVVQTSCAYRLGSSTRSLPGGYRLVSIPMFKNLSMEVGAEASFTKSLLQEFQRSKLGKIVDNDVSELKVIGEIITITNTATVKKASGDSSVAYLPEGTILTTAYKVAIKVSIQVVRQSDGVVMWKGVLDGDKTYPAAQVSLSQLNSVNPLYNLSAKRQNIDLLANELMAEAFDRMTENF